MLGNLANLSWIGEANTGTGGNGRYFKFHYRMPHFWKDSQQYHGQPRKETNGLLTDQVITQGTNDYLKLSNFGHIIWRPGSLEKAVMLGKRKGKERTKVNGLSYRGNSYNFGRLKHQAGDRSSWRKLLRAAIDLIAHNQSLLLWLKTFVFFKTRAKAPE